MRFASKKAWVPKSTSELEEESDGRGVREYEQNGGYNSAAMPQLPRQEKRERVEASNTNVVQVVLASLGSAVTVMTGECVLCQCGAAFSALSKVQVPEEGAANNNNNDNKKKGPIWTCEFCGNEAEVNLADEEIPKADTVDYLLEAPKAAVVLQDANTVVFCIDTSGSMCVTAPLQGNVKLKNQGVANAEANAFREHGAAQFLPNEAQGINYVSRLQCVQAAVEAQILLLQKTKPNTRVGLVTFSNDVVIYGDGTSQPVTVAGDKLNNLADLTEAGANVKELASVEKTGAALIKTLYGLEEKGTTALGPGLCVSLGMLKGAIAGSKIVLCTDGLANVGVGNMEDVFDIEPLDQFYRALARKAKDDGLTISVVAIEGSACKMEILGALTEVSGGDVDIVKPTEIGKNFQNILADEVVATKVEIKMQVHKLMTIVDPEFDGMILSVLKKELGNVTANSAATFEYRVIPASLEEAKAYKVLPFQLQIRYTRLDGSRLIRVQTLTQEVTSDREEAEQELNIDVLARNTVQQASNYASSGNYVKARQKMAQQQKVMAKAMRTPAARQEVQAKQSNDYAGFVHQAAELDDLLAEHDSPAPEMQSSAKKKSARSDKLSNAMYRGMK